MNLWNLQSPFYNTIRSLPGIKCSYKKELENLQALIQDLSLPEIILDLGTGTGSSLSLFPEESTVICLDISLAMLKRIRGENQIYKLKSNVGKLPIKKESISFISAVGLTEYFKDKSELLKQINACLNINGHLLITIAHPSFLNELRILAGHRIYTISESDWENLITQNGFQCFGKKHSTLQTQYFLQKISPSPI